MTIPIYLHGGGDDPQADLATFGAFIAAAKAGHSGSIGLVLVESSAQHRDAYAAIFERCGASRTDLAEIIVSPDKPLRTEMLGEHDLAGMFVCGGVTPQYQEALCRDRAWLEILREKRLVYGGTSAGAAIAARQALVGGWRAQRGDRTTEILFEGASEGLDLLDVRPGLGLVPFSVDVHASQMGTLTRLIHAVEMGMVDSGWAIDEITALEVLDNRVRVLGAGQAYSVRRSGQRADIQIVQAGDTIPL